jgi:hypothetical protein
MTPNIDKSEAHEDDSLDNYDEYVSENIGLSLRKRPTAKQKSLIIREIQKQNLNVDSDIDYDSIFEQHARDCFEPLRFNEPKIFSRVEYILRSFLAEDHPMSDDLALNDEEPPLCIRQLLKKPTVEQLAGVIKALNEQDPDWSWYDKGEGARKLVLALGHNFPELIKKNSRNQIIFGDKIQDSISKRPPPTPKAKRKKTKGGCLKLIIVFIILFVIIKSCTK